MLNEKDVENYWRKILSKSFPDAIITSPYNTDGVLEEGNLKVLLEFKYDLDFTNKGDRAIVIMQAIAYLKRFEQKGDKLPHIIFIADKNECFVLHANTIHKYMSYDVDWNVAPSEVYKHKDYVQMRLDLNSDTDLDLFVFNTNDPNLVSSVSDKIKDLNKNITRKVRITPNNIENVYRYFSTEIASKFKLLTNELANLFIQLLINPNDNYLHPKKRHTLITKANGELRVDDGRFKAFFSRFEADKYTNVEKKALSNCIDRLIEDETRRHKGEFYTPKIWVDKAHEYISTALGETWYDDYVVWDNSCGQGNLTKDYAIPDLIQTTIEQSDIDTITQAGINKGSIKMKLDFLNDDIPDEIAEKIKGKKVLVLMNPPYKTAGNNKRDSKSAKGVANHKTRDNMIKDKWSGYGQLYAQFIYRSLMLKREYDCEVSLAIFAPPLYLSSSSFSKFREKMFSQVEYDSGFMFRASEFSGTANNWSIVFSVFTPKSNDNDKV